MSALAWSNVLLWITVVVHTVLIIAILRHLGRSVLGARAVGVGEGPAVRTRPPAVPMETLRGDSLVPEDPSSGVRNVFFLSTTCKVCGHVLGALNEIRADHPADGDVFVIQGERNDVAAVVDEHGLDTRAVVPDPRARVFQSWDVTPRPFLVVLDDDGFVRDRGRPEARERLRELLRHNTPTLGPEPGVAEASPS